MIHHFNKTDLEDEKCVAKYQVSIKINFKN